MCLSILPSLMFKVREKAKAPRRRSDKGARWLTFIRLRINAHPPQEMKTSFIPKGGSLSIRSKDLNVYKRKLNASIYFHD